MNRLSLSSIIFFVSDALGTRWVTNTSAKKILLMDEVDGMAGNEDRGGVGELIQVCAHQNKLLHS